MWSGRASVGLQGRQIRLCGNFSSSKPLNGYKEQAGFSNRERGDCLFSSFPQITFPLHLAPSVLFISD